MMQRLSLLITGFLLSFPLPTFANDAQKQLCAGSKACTSAGKPTHGNNLTVKIGTITEALITVAGAIAVIIIIIAGIRYITSSGEASQVKQAKDAILYSVIGLIFVILAFAIVRFVVTSIK